MKALEFLPLARAPQALFALVLAALLCAAGTFEPRSAPRFIQEEVRVRPPGARYTLAVSIVRPRGEGPFGAIILNHGTGPTTQARRAESTALFVHTASAFADPTKSIQPQWYVPRERIPEV
jgi:hypothetical protein